MKQPQRYYETVFSPMVPVINTRRVDKYTVSGEVMRSTGPYKQGEVVTFMANNLVIKLGHYPSGHIKVRQVGPEFEE